MKLEQIVNCYKEQKKTLGSHLVAYGASTALAALASKLAADASGDNNIVSSVVGTFSAMGVYWPTFIGGLILRDKNEFKDESGIKWDGVKEKAIEYASWFGVGEYLYAGVRFGIQTYLQNKGYDASISSAISDTVTAVTYTAGLPFIQMGINYTNKTVKKFLRKK